MIRNVASALEYLHESVNVLHNDVKDDNIVLEKFCHSSSSSSINAVLIDFNRACPVTDARVPLRNSKELRDKGEDHEVNQGLRKQSKAADCYSFGYFVKTVRRICTTLADRLDSLVSNCMLSDSDCRPGISYIGENLK